MNGTFPTHDNSRRRAPHTVAMPLRIMVSRHSVFYSPLIATIAAGFLERRGVTAEYAILAKGQRSSALIRDGSVDIMQSAVSSNWKPMEQGESPLPVHFAQINRRDGFFLVAREPDAAFEWGKLAGQAVLADHAAQPYVMLKYAARSNGVEWARVNDIDAGSPEEMAAAFRQGRGAYVQLQSPAAHQLECDGVGHVVVSVGASMPPVAFSSLCCSRDFARTETFRPLCGGLRRGAPMGADGSGSGGGPRGGRLFRRAFDGRADRRHRAVPGAGLLGGRRGNSARPL